MKHLYGEFTPEQMEAYCTQLHRDLFLLILYKDPKTKAEFANVDFDRYYLGLMKKIEGLNSLLNHPVEIVSIMSLMEAALLETKKQDFNWGLYRKLILDAHSWVDKLYIRG